MSKNTTVICDRIVYVSGSISGEIYIELENLDLRFLLNINPRELLTNIDIYAVMNEMDIEELELYMKDRKDNA